MLRKLSTTLGILLLGSSLALAAQNTTPTQPATPKAPQAQSQNTPAKKHAKKHHKKGHKKQASQTKTSTSR
jgi:hypothetical protein